MLDFIIRNGILLNSLCEYSLSAITFKKHIWKCMFHFEAEAQDKISLIKRQFVVTHTIR
jgi:hypothetical protein